MSDSLIDSLIAAVSPDVIATASANLGVPRPEITHGLQTSVAAIGAGLATKTHDPGIVRRVFDLATGSGNAPAGAAAVTGSPDSPGAKLLHVLFGGTMSTVVGSIVQATGLRLESVTAILGMAAPIVLGVLGSHISATGLSAIGFNSWLAGQRNSLLRAGPAALRGVLGAREPAPPIPAAALNPRSSSRWLVPLIAAALVVGLLLNLIRRAPRQAAEVATRADTVSADTVSGDVARGVTTAVGVASAQAESAGAAVDRRLPNGGVLHVPAGGTESKLLAYLGDTSRPASDTVWFEFDRLLFDRNAATLLPASDAQLTDVATILAAYPTVHATIGGYTDNTGDAAANLQLSQDRARNVVRELVVRGIASDRLTAKGYGEEHPVADNNSEGGRAQNRRVALRVTRR